MALLSRWWIDRWEPLQDVLSRLHRLGRELGDDALARAGATVLRHAAFPPNIFDIRDALYTLDVAYHMNHRRNGEPMFVNGQLAPGIGCFVCTGDTPMSLIVDSASKYPCAFDRGLITAIARRYEPTAHVEHLDGSRCRKLGTVTCGYVVSWT